MFVSLSVNFSSIIFFILVRDLLLVRFSRCRTPLLFSSLLQTFRTIGELNSINVCRVCWSTKIEMFAQPSEESISREESPCQLINSSPIVMHRMNSSSRPTPRRRRRHRINSQSIWRSPRAASLLPHGTSSMWVVTPLSLSRLTS